MSTLEFPFLDLFQTLQREGMKLSPEQYDLLRQALGQGFGLANWDGNNWDDLRQVCRVLWVKPNCNYDAHIFERVFNQYVTAKRHAIQAWQPKPKPPQEKAPEPPKPKRQWPKVPPGKLPTLEDPTSEEAKKLPVSVQTGLEGLPAVKNESEFVLIPDQMPLSQRVLLDSWRLMRRPLRQGLRNELDLEATIQRIAVTGYFSDVVMRPVKSKRAELIILVDDSNGMLPYRPALKPLVQTIETAQITPATLYRFTTYPDDYLYDWEQPTQVVPIDRVLSRMHSRRSIVLIWSDAGANQLNPADEHRDGLKTFLTRLSPCMRSLIWLNPVPAYRWGSTLAAEVAYWLDGRMTHLSLPRLLALAKQPVSDDHLFLKAPVVAR